MPSKSSKIILALGVGLALMVAACATAPYTGRHQIILGSEDTEISKADKTYEELRSRYPTCPDPALNALVTRVGRRIAGVTERPDYHWEFVVLVNDVEANAFFLPGGKVVIFTGVLKFTRDEAGLATVLAHEAGHALARHTGERQSQATLAKMGGLGLGLGVGGVGGLAGQAIGEGYSLGIKYGILPLYSRTQELEADKIGLILMAKAGYDPALALDFWRRMMTDEDVKLRPPQFLTIHPRDHSTMQAMVDFLPGARHHYVRKAKAAPAPLAPAPEVVTPAPPAPPAATPPAPAAAAQPEPPTVPTTPPAVPSNPPSAAGPPSQPPAPVPAAAPAPEAVPSPAAPAPLPDKAPEVASPSQPTPPPAPEAAPPPEVK